MAQNATAAAAAEARHETASLHLDRLHAAGVEGNGRAPDPGGDGSGRVRAA